MLSGIQKSDLTTSMILRLPRSFKKIMRLNESASANRISNHSSISVTTIILTGILSCGIGKSRFLFFGRAKLIDRLLCEPLPGFNTVEGKSEWFGESGKCCVSKQNADRKGVSFILLTNVLSYKKNTRIKLQSRFGSPVFHISSTVWLRHFC